MCKAKPGKHCPEEAEADLTKATNALNETFPDAPPVDPAMAAQAQFAAPATSQRSEVFTTRYDSVEDKIAAFREELDAKIADLDNDENWNAYLETASRFHSYSFANQMLIAMQRPNATRVAGFRTWQSMDRHVNKGEKAISIFAPKTAWVDAKDADGKPKIGKDGKPLKEKRCVGFTTASVFDVSQTGGKPLPEQSMALSETPPEGFTSDLETAVAAHGYTVEYADTGQASGYTSKKDKKVVIGTHLSDGDKALTLAHELGHIAAGHMDRTDYHTGPDGHRGQMEVEAEAIGFILCRSAGMKTPAQASGGYVKGWSAMEQGTDREVVAKSAEHISKTVKTLLTTQSWTHTSTTTEQEAA